MGPRRHLVVHMVVYGGKGIITSSSFGGGLVVVHRTSSQFGGELVAVHGISPCSSSNGGVWWEGRRELVVIWQWASSRARCHTVLVVILCVAK